MRNSDAIVIGALADLVQVWPGLAGSDRAHTRPPDVVPAGTAA